MTKPINPAGPWFCALFPASPMRNAAMRPASAGGRGGAAGGRLGVLPQPQPGVPPALLGGFSGNGERGWAGGEVRGILLRSPLSSALKSQIITPPQQPAACSLLCLPAVLSLSLSALRTTSSPQAGSPGRTENRSRRDQRPNSRGHVVRGTPIPARGSGRSRGAAGWLILFSTHCSL